MKRLIIILSIALMSTQLVSAIDAPMALHWHRDSRMFTWELSQDAPYATFYFDGTLRGFLRYQCQSYIVDKQWLSPGIHTFSLCASDASGNYSPFVYLNILIEGGDEEELPTVPEPPSQLSWQMSGSNSLVFSWNRALDDTNSAIGYCVFVDQDMVSYHQLDTFYTVQNLRTGHYELGVCTINGEGYVSEAATIIAAVTTPDNDTISLNDACWDLDDWSQCVPNGEYSGQTMFIPKGWVVSEDLSLPQNTPFIEPLNPSDGTQYGMTGSRAMRLEGMTGKQPFAILPRLTDCYDNMEDNDDAHLELHFYARPCYWSDYGSYGLWKQCSNQAELKLGILPYVPREGDFMACVQEIMTLQLPIANMLDTLSVDSTAFWREYTIPLTNDIASQHVVFYLDCTSKNYVLLDDICFQYVNPTLPDDREDPSQPDDREDPSQPDQEEGNGEAGIDDVQSSQIRCYKRLENGNIVIHIGCNSFDVMGRLMENRTNKSLFY